jgi:hypothetical protein
MFMRPPSKLQQKIIFDAAMILMAVGLLALSTVAQGKTAPGRQGVPSVFLGFYVIYLGVLFLLSYFYSHASYVLGALMWTCEHFSHPRGRFMALFYFGLSLVLGVCALLAAFGRL